MILEVWLLPSVEVHLTRPRKWQAGALNRNGNITDCPEVIQKPGPNGHLKL